MEDRLKKFVAIVEAGSYTLAAQRLRTSQPGLSLAVQKLERELKVKLLTGKGRGFVLTPSGKVAYQYGRHLVRENKQFYREIQRTIDQKPLLRLGAIDSLADLLFVRQDLLESLRASADVTLQVNNTKTLLNQVHEGDCDLALIVAQDVYPSDIEVFELGNEELLFVCSPKLYAGATEQLQFGVLRDFMSYNTGSNTYRMIEKYLQENGISAQSIFDSTSPELMLRLALAGKGTAVLPVPAVDPYITDGQLVVLRIGGSSVKRPLVAVVPKGRDRIEYDRVISLARSALDFSDV